MSRASDCTKNEIIKYSFLSFIMCCFAEDIEISYLINDDIEFENVVYFKGNIALCLVSICLT